jgi:hypothetical protein
MIMCILKCMRDVVCLRAVTITLSLGKRTVRIISKLSKIMIIKLSINKEALVIR